MVAVAKIETKEKTFEPGETVTGLSKADTEWMLKGGYIRQDEPKNAEAKKGTDSKPGGKKNEL